MQFHQKVVHCYQLEVHMHGLLFLTHSKYTHNAPWQAALTPVFRRVIQKGYYIYNLMVK